MPLSKEIITQNINTLIQQFESWDQNVGSKQSYSVEHEGRVFRVVFDKSIDPLFKHYDAIDYLRDNIIFQCDDTGKLYARVEFSLTNCGVNEYSDFVDILRKKGVESLGCIMGFDIDSFQDSKKPRKMIALYDDEIIGGLKLDGESTMPPKFSKGDTMVEKVSRCKVKFYNISPVLNLRFCDLAKKSFLERLEGEYTKIERRKLSEPQYTLRDRYPENVEEDEIDDSTNVRSSKILEASSIGRTHFF